MFVTMICTEKKTYETLLLLLQLLLSEVPPNLAEITPSTVMVRQVKEMCMPARSSITFKY